MTKVLGSHGIIVEKGSRDLSLIAKDNQFPRLFQLKNASVLHRDKGIFRFSIESSDLAGCNKILLSAKKELKPNKELLKLRIVKHGKNHLLLFGLIKA